MYFIINVFIKIIKLFFKHIYLNKIQKIFIKNCIYILICICINFFESIHLFIINVFIYNKYLFILRRCI